MSYPIILAHGVCPFDFLWNKFLQADNKKNQRLDRFHYFRGVRTMLQKKGFDGHHSRVSWAASVDTRAEDLRKNVLRVLKATGANRVNIIAHSMGGLDCRHMLFNDRNRGGIHEKVASLTTISTPHHGSPYADWGLDHLPFVIPGLWKLGLNLAALKDLRTDACRKYNDDPEVIAFEKSCEKSIVFQTYAGRQSYRSTLTFFKVSFRIIEKAEGENDGLVSVQSAKWRERYFRGTIDNCDHLNELGWWGPDQLRSGESPAQLLRRMHRFYAELAHGLP